MTPTLSEMALRFLLHSIFVLVCVVCAVACGDNLSGGDDDDEDAGPAPSGLLGAWTITATLDCRADPQVLSLGLYPDGDLVQVTTGREMVAVGAELGAVAGHVTIELNPGGTGAEVWDLRLADDGATATAALDWSGPGDNARGCTIADVTVTLERERLAL